MSSLNVSISTDLYECCMFICVYIYIYMYDWVLFLRIFILLKKANQNKWKTIFCVVLFYVLHKSQLLTFWLFGAISCMYICLSPWYDFLFLHTFVSSSDLFTLFQQNYIPFHLKSAGDIALNTSVFYRINYTKIKLE